MNQQNTMAATAAANLVQDIATRLYGHAGEGVKDLIGLANLVQAEADRVGQAQGTASIDATDPWRGLYTATRLPPRCEYGEVVHPDLPKWPDDREEALDKLVRAQGFDFVPIAGDFTDEALENGDQLYWEEMRSWNPEAPEGDWRLAWMGDTEDGPYAWFVRPMALRPEPAAPPAPEVKLEPVRAALHAAEGLCVCCASVDGYSRNELYAFGVNMRSQFRDAISLLDCQTVRHD